MEARSNPLELLYRINLDSLTAFLESYPQGFLLLSRDGRVEYANPVAKQLFNHNTTAGHSIFDAFSEQTVSQQKKVFEEIIADGSATNSGMKSEAVIHGDDVAIPVELTYSCVDDGASGVIFCVVSDISERVELQQKLFKQAISDPLTGLYNRRYFDERLGQEFKRSSRHGRSFSVIIMDIDGFKQANDLFGHGYGDEMLIAATEIFQKVLRDDDSAYRYGGDEFAMLLPETAKEGAIEVSERLRSAFAKFVSSTKQRIKLSLSIGVASFPEDGTDEKSMIGTADRRMYFSKEHGGNMVTAMDTSGCATDRLLQSLTSLMHLIERKRGQSASEKGLHHSQNIRSLVVKLGMELGLSKNELVSLEQAAMLHDIGTIYIPSAILNKKGKLTPLEWADIQRHTLIGEEIIESIANSEQSESVEQLIALKEIIGQHHEKIDGSGYPRGLKDSEIRFEAQVLAVSDAYTALLADRPYRKAYSKEAALTEMKRLSGSHFSPKVVEQLVSLETQH